MCGIAGLIDRRGGAAGEADRILSAMSADIARRGPDGAASWSDPGCGVYFAHRRLSIIDLSAAGDQPLASDDGRVMLCYNGMLYNAGELRADLIAAGRSFRGHSDTEVVANGLAAWGAEALLPRLLGMFAFAAWWRDERRLVLARDRLGKKPLYWGKIAGGLAFSSELPSLCRHPAIDRTIDRGAAASFLRTGHVPDPLSIIVGAKKLPAGNMLTLTEGAQEPVIAQWWSLAKAVEAGRENPLPGGPDAALSAAGTLIDDAVARRMVSDVPFGAFLSGGIDSSLIVARMQAVSGARVSTFSIGYKEAAYDESGEAEAVAKHLGTDHHSFILSPDDVFATIEQLPAIYGEPFADPSAVPSTILAERARQHVTMVLTGDGGDEVFAGYNRYVAARGLLAKVDRLPIPVRRALGAAMSTPTPAAWDRAFALVPQGMRPRSAGEKLHKLAPMLTLGDGDRYQQVTSQWPDVNVIRTDTEPLEPALADAEVLLSDPVERLRYLDLMTYLPGDILTKVDRATMAHGLEARAPLLDHRLVELSFRLPTATLMNEGRPKWILRKLLERDVPRALFERPKSGFGIPIGDWLRGPMRDWAEELLSVPALEESGLVRPKAVRAVWAAHLSGAVNAQYGLWNVLMLQSWRSQFPAALAIART